MMLKKAVSFCIDVKCPGIPRSSQAYAKVSLHKRTPGLRTDRSTFLIFLTEESSDMKLPSTKRSTTCLDTIFQTSVQVDWRATINMAF